MPVSPIRAKTRTLAFATLTKAKRRPVMQHEMFEIAGPEGKLAIQRQAMASHADYEAVVKYIQNRSPV